MSIKEYDRAHHMAGKRRIGRGILFLILFLFVPMYSHAYFGANEDYILRPEKPASWPEGHGLEFAFDETYTIKPGDTLWGIAETYWGSGIYYRQIVVENQDVLDNPDLIMPGTVLNLKRNLYTRVGVGVGDYIDHDVFKNEMLVDDPGAFTMEDFIPPYRIFASVPYVNDLQEADPYANWEEFQKEVTRCSRQVCGDRVSDLSFERCEVTGIGPLCSYSFRFDAEGKEYKVTACICYTATTKSEAYALCDLEYCTKKDLEEARGKAFYAAVCYLNPGIYYVKTQDYTGGEDWNYPQLRNPFTDAMHNLYTGPLERVKEDDKAVIVQWKNPAFELAVREELADLWQLTPKEKQDFMAADMTTADLSRIEELMISYDGTSFGKGESLSVELNQYGEKGYYIDESNSTKITAEVFGQAGLLTTLEDLRNFPELKILDVVLRDSSITDFSCIGDLTDLRVLRCRVYSDSRYIDNVDFLGSLVNLRTLRLGGVTGGRFTGFFENVTDLSVLRNCPHLAYLSLVTGNVESYDFLEELPEIYYLYIDAASGCKNIMPNEELLSNACFITLYGDDVRFEVGDGY